MTIVNLDIAKQCYEKRTKHHARALKEIWKPIVAAIELVAKQGSIKCHKTRLYFSYDGRDWKAEPTTNFEGDYDGIQIKVKAA
jgi:hypothetical protein